MVSVAIDGPAGAGKSTIARAIARELGYLYVDTGALYRAIGLFALEQGADPKDPEQVLPLLERTQLSLRFAAGEQQVWLNGRDVSQQIRQNPVSMAASAVSAIPQVRAFLFDLQQNLAKENNVVMDGRDIGTVVLPQAQVKIFLTASPEERARRRHEELAQRGQQVDYAQLLEEVRRRDYNDAHRAAAPLRQAPDALLVDTTGNSLEWSVAQLTEIVKERLRDVL
ncbi:MAG TPA: (d)CMP kinase [Candidatus Anaerotruncus excrementipullorum]|uniref:Cytidylate kinase n=1 Tax=Candidatus Anaerotruncus excrementipullorum TaxID=2838465 RepID=A0A9D1WR73_9FIRM|nr:(d)CMP kinase [Candidatus Anaerotruncus excrementipullorum]